MFIDSPLKSFSSVCGNAAAWLKPLPTTVEDSGMNFHTEHCCSALMPVSWLCPSCRESKVAISFFHWSPLPVSLARMASETSLHPPQLCFSLFQNHLDSIPNYFICTFGLFIVVIFPSRTGHKYVVHSLTSVIVPSGK